MTVAKVWDGAAWIPVVGAQGPPGQSTTQFQYQYFNNAPNPDGTCTCSDVADPSQAINLTVNFVDKNSVDIRPFLSVVEMSGQAAIIYRNRADHTKYSSWKITDRTDNEAEGWIGFDVQSLSGGSGGEVSVGDIDLILSIAGPEGPPGPMEVYVQPNDPGAVQEGAVWIDTDQGAPVAITSQIIQTYTMTAGYTKDRAFNPQATSLGETATVLATLIDDLKTAGVIKP